MLKIVARTAIRNLKIKKSMSKLFQAFVYHNIDNKEHTGYKSESGKVFKSTNFKIIYQNEFFTIYFTTLNREYEERLAFEILKNGLKLGELHFAETLVEIRDRQTEKNEIVVKGYLSANIKDGDSNRKIWLEPRYHKFIEIITNHSIDKYETLLGESYEEEIKIEMLEKKRDKRVFFYGNQPIESWLATYKIKATAKMINLLLDTGVGANGMKGVGFLEVVK